MPLQNRVDPFGNLHAVEARGTLMGNRGGRFHTAEQSLHTRRWATRAGITCLCGFKNRKREVWGNSYTELFFLDEVTALSAGHRPCFECRNTAAKAFQRGFAGHSPNDFSETGFSAPEIDKILHLQRLNNRHKRVHAANIDDLPDGAMVLWQDAPHAIRGPYLLAWSFEGYTSAVQRPTAQTVAVLTPAASVAALRVYTPAFHDSAARFF